MGIGSKLVPRRKAVFLDRDGVLNRASVRGGKPYPPRSLQEVELLDGVQEAAGRLRAKGFLLVAVTNQPDVARGTASVKGVEAINALLVDRLGLDLVKTCFHDDDDECACRKPKPGLLLDASRQLDIDLGASFMVGDRWKDIAAGEAAGCTTVFVDHGYAERQPESPDYRCGSLLDWVNQLDEAGRRAR